MPDLDVFRGDDNVYLLNVIRNNAPVDITGAKFWFTAKLDEDSPDSAAEIALNSVTNGSQVSILQAAAGTVQIVLHPADTQNITEEALYFDVQMKESNGRITTVSKGVLHLTKDVTKATT